MKNFHLGENVKRGLARWFFSPYTSLDVAEDDSGFENDGWVMDSAVVGA